MLERLRAMIDVYRLPQRARRARRADRMGLPVADPGIDAVVAAGIAWLGRAQDNSASADGGVARDYSLLRGWATSYPETTGYIVPTLLEHARRQQCDESRSRARRMLEWLVDIQLPGGGYQGGRIDAEPVVPVTFNTGQILLGLAAGVSEFGDFEHAARRAADWLVASQDPDGCWRNYPTPFAAPGEKTYETHVSWGLFEAERVLPGRGYAEAGLRQVAWALSWQRDNGWMDRCCLTDPRWPLTHTLGYALRGILEAHRYSGDRSLLESAIRLAEGLSSALGPDGRLPGRLDAEWRPAAPWVCLTGSVQIAWCWLTLYELTGRREFLDAGRRANAFVRRTIDVQGPPETRGGVKGSFPIDGDYGRFEYLNWACKFSVDANVKEADVQRAQSSSQSEQMAKGLSISGT